MALKRKNTSNENGKAKKGFWNQGLLASMEDPELKEYEDEQIVIIKDKYPKARFHFLVLPRENISNLKALKKDHVDLLRHMEKKGREIAKRSNSESQFKVGYHISPHMSRLHLHVISRDFDSVCLKTKQHWNSFNTDFFVPSCEIIDQLEETGHIQGISAEEAKELINTPLRCHVCNEAQATMPKLKSHILKHIK